MHPNILKHLHNVLKPSIKYTGFFAQHEVTFLYDVAQDVIMYVNANGTIVKLVKQYLQLFSGRLLVAVVVPKSSFSPAGNFLQASANLAINVSKFNGHFAHPLVSYSVKPEDEANVAVVKLWDEFLVLEKIIPHCERIAMLQDYRDSIADSVSVIATLYPESSQIAYLVTEQKKYLDRVLALSDLDKSYNYCGSYVTKPTS